MGKCGNCGKSVRDNNKLICIYDSFYCSKKCALLCLLEKRSDLTQTIYDIIRSLKE